MRWHWPAYKIVFELWQQTKNIAKTNFNWPIRHGSDYVSLKEIDMVQIMSASKKLVDLWLFSLIHLKDVYFRYIMLLLN
jgi:hypothetical protein